MEKFNTIFKGYVKMDGKIPKQSIKDSSYYTLDEILDLDCDFGGVLKDYVIMVDIDDRVSANKIKEIVTKEKIDCVILRTSRGYHFYFENNGIDKNKIKTKIAIGLEADIKLGSNNTVVPLRMDGAMRELVGNSLSTLPAIFKPVKYAKNLSESTTRNQDLFNYILTLQSENFNTVDIQYIITIINNYIIPTPLPNKELEIILRNEAFSKPNFFIKNQFQHHKFAEWMIQEKNIKRINGLLHFYNNSKYSMSIEPEMIKVIPTLTAKQRSEAMKYIDLLVPENTKETEAKYIQLKDKILNIENMEISQSDHTKVITNIVDYEYKKDAYFAPLDKVLDKVTCNDKNLRLTLEEMFGYCLYRRNEMGKFFVLTGDGGGGKSTILNMLNTLFGHDNISSVSFKDCGDKFLKSDIVGKLVNIGDDISGAYIDDNADFKKLVTGEQIQFQFKNQQPFKASTYAKLLFASNDLPKVKDMSDGLMRRLIIIPFNAKFTKDADYDPFIGDKLKTDDSIEYLLKLAVDGLKRVLKNNGFTKSQLVNNAADEYESYNNSVVGFYNELQHDDGFKIINSPVKMVYRSYCIFCSESGLQALSNPKFAKVLKDKYKIIAKVVKVSKNKTMRLYVEE